MAPKDLPDVLVKRIRDNVETGNSLSFDLLE